MALPFCRRKVSFLSMFEVPNLASPHVRESQRIDGPANDLDDPPQDFQTQRMGALPLSGLNLNRNQTGQSGPYCKLRPTRVPYF